ncbi:hypothetical protein NDU88_002472 [Pleurodeles waltl]|uniref:Uncharacterized protein n=1 Tax=Pleurodeles waltl TaxID=8319 RepID=A0AAV7UXB7_PLEWA|nr:hypothetical protein NDU88_002472 [Pleurodeles waltl]
MGAGGLSMSSSSLPASNVAGSHGPQPWAVHPPSSPKLLAEKRHLRQLAALESAVPPELAGAHLGERGLSLRSQSVSLSRMSRLQAGAVHFFLDFCRTPDTPGSTISGQMWADEKIYVAHTVELSTEQYRPVFTYFSDLSAFGDYRNQITQQSIAETEIVMMSQQWMRSGERGMWSREGTRILP